MRQEKNCCVFGGFNGVLGVSRVILCSQVFFCQSLYPAGELGLLSAVGTVSRGGQIPIIIPTSHDF